MEESWSASVLPLGCCGVSAGVRDGPDRGPGAAPQARQGIRAGRGLGAIWPIPLTGSNPPTIPQYVAIQTPDGTLLLWEETSLLHRVFYSVIAIRQKNQLEPASR